MLDELRVWLVPRSAAEISGLMHTAVMGAATGLVLCWAFDDVAAADTAGGGGILRDTSGHGSDGTLGAVPSAVRASVALFMVGGRVLPTAPELIVSTAPLVGSAHQAVWAPALEAGVPVPITVAVVAAAGDSTALSLAGMRVLTWPTFGTLSDSVNGATLTATASADTAATTAVTYTPAAATAAAATDAFCVAVLYVDAAGAVRGVNCTVHVLGAHMDDATLMLTVSSDGFVRVNVGGVDGGGQPITAVIDQAPTGGALGYPIFRYASDTTYDKMVGGGAPIANFTSLSFPGSLTAPVVYTPAARLRAGGSDAFVVARTASSASASLLTAIVDVSASSTPPSAFADTVVAPPGGSGAFVVQLQGTIDSSGGGSGRATPSYIVVAGLDPALGGLYQVDPATGGVLLQGEPIVVRTPTYVDQYAPRVVNASSQYSSCGCGRPWEAATTGCSDPGTGVPAWRLQRVHGDGHPGRVPRLRRLRRCVVPRRRRWRRRARVHRARV
jgi:hypothetical protein